MSGLRANTVHQSPVVPSQRPGSATGSRPSKSHSYMVVTMGAVASSLGTWRSRGMWCVGVWVCGVLGSDRRRLAGELALGREVVVEGPGGGVRDVVEPELAQPAGEF